MNDTTMNQTTTAFEGIGSQDASQPKTGPGAQLASQREARGWTIEQVATQLNLAPRQIHALDHFLNGYSDRLMHIAAWIADEEETPARISDESIRLLEQTFENQSSPNSQAITDICQKMVSSLLMLRNEC